MARAICEVCGNYEGQPHEAACPLAPKARPRKRLLSVVFFDATGEPYHRANLPRQAAISLLARNGVTKVRLPGDATGYHLGCLSYAECARQSRAFSGKTIDGNEVLITVADV